MLIMLKKGVMVKEAQGVGERNPKNNIRLHGGKNNSVPFLCFLCSI